MLPINEMHNACNSVMGQCVVPEQTLNSMFFLLRMGDVLQNYCHWGFKMFILGLFSLLLYLMDYFLQDLYRNFGEVGAQVYLRFEGYFSYVLYFVLLTVMGSDFALMLLILELFRLRHYRILPFFLLIAFANNVVLLSSSETYAQNSRYPPTESEKIVSFLFNGIAAVFGFGLNCYQFYMLSSRIVSHLPKPIEMAPLDPRPTAPPNPNLMSNFQPAANQDSVNFGKMNGRTGFDRL